MIQTLKRIHSILNNSESSKWGGGISLLWRGNNFSLYAKAFRKSLTIKKISTAKEQEYLLFESARVAIYQYAKYVGIGPSDRVQILGFTCDAVTSAIEHLGAEIELYDCDENLESTDFSIKKDTKLIICQSTFGINSIGEDILDDAINKNIHVLVDKSLSYGQSDFDSFYSDKYPEIFSFEVSKSFTIGWGGILKLPNVKAYLKFKNYYDELGTVNIFNDIYRVLSTLLNLYMVNKGGLFQYYLWLLLRVLRIHRISANSSNYRYHKKSKLGSLSKKIFNNLYFKISEKIARSNKIHQQLKNVLEEKGFKVISKVSYNCSVPRIAFLIEPQKRSKLYDWLKTNKIEMGFWFNQLPMYSDNDLNGIENLFEKVVNIPCHWTLKNHELNKIVNTLREFK